MLALVTPVGADSDTVLRALFRVKAFARTTGADLQSIDEEEPDVASMLMIASLASLLEDPILYEALRGFERPSDLDGVRDIAIALYSKSRSRKRATPSADPTRDRGGYAASGEGSRRACRGLGLHSRSCSWIPKHVNSKGGKGTLDPHACNPRAIQHK